MIKADLHTHTSYFHGNNTPEEMYKAAQDTHLEYYGITEHSPLPDGFSCSLYNKCDLNLAFDTCVQSVQELKQLNSKPQILLGVELDWLPQNIPFVQGIIDRYDYDYVIGSVHFIGYWNFAGHKNWILEDIGKDEEERTFEMFSRYTAYYKTLKSLAEFGKTDIMAHCDFIKLHALDFFHSWLATKEAKELIESVLWSMKESGMALEVSSGGLLKPCKEIHPSPIIMELAAKMDLPITFASDAHSVSTITHAFDELETFARSYGYKKYCVFQNRERFYLDF